MEPKTFEESCLKVAVEIAELVSTKQRDYGKNNILDFGELGVLVRTNDKIARLKNLILNQKKPLNETEMDSWRDICGYALIAILLDRGWFELPLEED